MPQRTSPDGVFPPAEKLPGDGRLVAAQQGAGRDAHYPRPVMRAEGPPATGSTEAAGYADRYAVESHALVETRARAARLSTPPMQPSAGAALALLAATGGGPPRGSVGRGGGAGPPP